jgi:hypothetical protein
MLDKPVSQKLPVARCYDTYVMNGNRFVFMPSLPPPPGPADAGALSLSFGFLGGSGGGGSVMARAANAAPLLSFGFQSCKPTAAPAAIAVVSGGTRGLSFLYGSCDGSGGVVIATAKTSPPLPAANDDDARIARRATKCCSAVNADANMDANSSADAPHGQPSVVVKQHHVVVVDGPASSCGKDGSIGVSQRCHCSQEGCQEDLREEGWCRVLLLLLLGGAGAVDLLNLAKTAIILDPTRNDDSNSKPQAVPQSQVGA